MEERKFVCKYCSKRFPCGKSLGGHIRNHMIDERINVDSGDIALEGERKRKRDLCSEVGGGGNSIYDLRENPKKTVRFVHSDPITLEQQQEEEEKKLCKECGKGFPSLKALCGHMACHSEKEKQKLVVMDSQFNTETTTTTTDPMHPRRSKRMRFIKTLSLSNHLSCSSSVSEVEQEEEVARCLMLLSKESSHKGHFDSVRESSNDMIAPNNGRKIVSNGYELVEEKLVKDIKLRFKDNSDSGYFKRKMLSRCRSKYSVTAMEKFVMMEDLDYDRTSGVTTRKFDHGSLSHKFGGISSKNTSNGFTNSEKYENGYTKGGSYNNSTNESEEQSSYTDSFLPPKSHKNRSLNGKKSSKAKKKKLKSQKIREHKCPICFRIFLSGQALGGHKRSHFVGGAEHNTLVIKQDAPVVPCRIDLNLPAPVDE